MNAITQSPITKQAIAKSFGGAAHSYDAVASLQRAIGDKLLDKLPDLSCDHVLDLGCGTGHFMPRLAKKFPGANLLGMDLAEGMALHASRQQISERLLWSCGDAESLPLVADRLSLIFSSMALQWCSDLAVVFSEAMRVLRPGGILGFSIPGPQTLHELKTAWQKVDGYVHVNAFASAEEILHMADRAGFKAQLCTEMRTAHYGRLGELTTELKALGAHNINSGRPTGLTGRSRIQTLLAGYECFRNKAGLLPATWQIYYLILEKP